MSDSEDDFYSLGDEPQEINLSGRYLDEKDLLTEIDKIPVGTKYVNVSFNNLKILPELPPGLISLNCYYNKIVKLPKLPKSLQSLNCSSNKLKEMPILPWQMDDLECNDNNFTDNIYYSDPDEIKIYQYNKRAGELRLPMVDTLPSERDYDAVVYHDTGKEVDRFTDLALIFPGVPPYVLAEIADWEKQPASKTDLPRVSAFDVVQIAPFMDSVKSSMRAVKNKSTSTFNYPIRPKKSTKYIE